MQIQFNTFQDYIPADQAQAVADAVATLLTCVKRAPESDEAPVAVATTLAPVSAVVEAVAEKPKRKRRTKKQIAADKAATDSAAVEKTVEPAPVEDSTPAVEDQAGSGAAVAPEPEVDPLADAPVVSESDVKTEVMAAVKRLNAAGQDKVEATKTVVEALVAATGKNRVGEIPSVQYGVVLGALKAL